MFLQDDEMFAKNIIIETINSIKANPDKSKDIIINMFKNRTTYGDSPLHFALRYGQKDIIKRILMLMSVLKTDAEELVNIQNSSGKVNFLMFCLINISCYNNYFLIYCIICHRLHCIMLFHKNMQKLQKHCSCLVQIQIYQTIMDKCHCTEPLNVCTNLKTECSF